MSLRDVQDDVWVALGAGPRRFFLGRDRCDRLTRIALDVLSHEGCYSSAAMHEGYRIQVEDTVRGTHTERCSGFFTTFILSWAISAIVQALIARWLNLKGGAK